MARVPLVDIAPFLQGSASDKEAVARAVDRACRDSGFLVITGHGVPARLRADVEKAMMDFFALPVEVKERWAFTPANPRGYRAMAATTLAKSRGEDSPPDILERFSIGQFDMPDDAYYNARRSTVFHDNRWPDAVAAFEPSAKAYYREMERLAADLMRLFARALDLPERYFEPYFDRHISLLVTNFYPAQRERPRPGQLRAGAHTDYGTLTILYGEDTPGGLQVKNRKGTWIDVHPAPRSFVINLGDAMARWTNDRWVSTLHRVVNPPREFARHGRLSIAFFHQPNHDADIRCLETCQGPGNPPRYAPMVYGAYRIEKTLATRLAEPAA